MADVGVVITAKEQVSAAASRASGALEGAASAAQRAAGAMSTLKAAAAGGFAGLKSIASGALNAAKAVGVTLLGALASVVGIFALVKRGLNTLRESADRVAVGVGDGLAPAMSGAADAGDRLGSSVGETATALEDAGRKIEVTLGAFGDVGAGFVQRAGAVTEDTKAQADKATGAANAAKAALDSAGGAFDSNTARLSRFGEALDRISAAFGGARDKIFAAIAGALTPALEAFADVLESPAFQTFVDLLADELAEAASAISEWLINEGIPAFVEFMEQVNEAGGLLTWASKKFREFRDGVRTTMLQISAIILYQLVKINRVWRSNWEMLKQIVGRAVSALKDMLGDLRDRLAEIFDGIAEFITGSFSGLEERLSTVFAQIGKTLTGPFQDLKDLASEVFDIIGQGLDNLPAWFLALLGLGGNGADPDPGDPAPQSVRGLGGLRDGGGLSVNVYVTAPDGANAQAFGASAAGGMLNEMRRRGIRVPTLA